MGTATSENGAACISEWLEPLGGIGMLLNVTDNDSITQVLAATVERFGAPLVLVNNAGITRDNILMRMKDSDWDDVIETNLKGVYRLSKACLSGMTKARWGRIINVTSVTASMGNVGQSNYAASKAVC